MASTITLDGNKIVFPTDVEDYVLCKNPAMLKVATVQGKDENDQPHIDCNITLFNPQLKNTDSIQECQHYDS